MKILVTGGCGYIGSHTVCELLDNNYEVVIIDNLSNSYKKVLKNIEKITKKSVKFYENDVCDKIALKKIFSENQIDAVIHTAGLKSFQESTDSPLAYYRTNIDSTLSLLETMDEFSCKKLVFSSSASVYGEQEELPVNEEADVSPLNPYANTKLIIENMLNELYNSDNEWSIALLRYFNPAGAHNSGLIGDDSNGVPTNLMPYITKVATSVYPELKVFGNDYNTIDGTGVRDYVHVVDLARAHIKAIEKVLSTKEIDCYNLGTGKYYSVLEVVKTFERINDVEIKYTFVDRRPGDVAKSYSDSSNALRKLGWKAERNLEDMCRDSYNFVIQQHINKIDEEENYNS